MNFFRTLNLGTKIKYYIYTDPYISISTAGAIFGGILLFPCFSIPFVPPSPDAHHKYHEHWQKIHSQTTDVNKSITPRKIGTAQIEDFGDYLRPDNVRYGRFTLQDIKDGVSMYLNKKS
jgi:hypothetical protein